VPPTSKDTKLQTYASSSEEDWDDYFGPDNPAEKKEEEIVIPVQKKPAIIHKDWKTEVITAQQFDGCWDEQAIIKILGGEARKALEEKPYMDTTIWCSALALAILELKCMDSKTSWEVVSNKGRAFMAKKLVPLEKKDTDEIFKIIVSLINKAKGLLINLV